MRTIWLSITILILGLGVEAQKKEILPADVLFTSDAKVEYGSDVTSRFAKGTSNGVAYRYYLSDGSGSFEASKGNGIDYRMGAGDNWSVSCKKDALDDSKTCVMSLYDLRIFVGTSLGTFVSIGGDIFPGSSVAFRLDQQPAVTGGTKGIFTGNAAKEIIEGLKTAKQVTTRYNKWPSGVNQDKTFELYGFNEAFAYINWALKQIK